MVFTVYILRMLTLLEKDAGKIIRQDAAEPDYEPCPVGSYKRRGLFVRSLDAIVVPIWVCSKLIPASKVSIS